MNNITQAMCYVAVVILTIAVMLMIGFKHQPKAQEPAVPDAITKGDDGVVVYHFTVTAKRGGK